MSFPRKLTNGAAAIALVVGSSAGVLLISAGSASAKAQTHCKILDGGNYPPAKCFIVFDDGTVHAGDTVRFQGHKFTPGTTVEEHLKCGKHHTNLGTDTAGGKGIVRDSFTLPQSTPKHHCRLKLTGGGSTIVGGFESKG